jgi:solute carrier family 36 (proton-coupled amino acid transporter)
LEIIQNAYRLAQSVMLFISVGVILGYAIQFFIPIQIMFPTLQANFKIINQYPLPSEMIFRVLMVLVTFAVAFLVPNLGLLISLIGAICSTSLALVFPVMIELLVITRNDESPAPAVLIKDFLILLLAIIGFFSGGYESLRLIVKLY